MLGKSQFRYHHTLLSRHLKGSVAFFISFFFVPFAILYGVGDGVWLA